MPPKKPQLKKRFLSSAVNIDDSDDEDYNNKNKQQTQADSDVSQNDDSESIMESSIEDEEETIFEEEGEDAEIRPEDEEDIVRRALQDLKVEDQKEKQERKKTEQIFLPQDLIDSNEV